MARKPGRVITGRNGGARQMPKLTSAQKVRVLTAEVAELRKGLLAMGEALDAVVANGNVMEKYPIAIHDALLKAGVLTEEQIDEALEAQGLKRVDPEDDPLEDDSEGP